MQNIDDRDILRIKRQLFEAIGTSRWFGKSNCSDNVRNVYLRSKFHGIGTIPKIAYWIHKSIITVIWNVAVYYAEYSFVFEKVLRANDT